MKNFVQNKNSIIIINYHDFELWNVKSLACSRCHSYSCLKLNASVPIWSIFRTFWEFPPGYYQNNTGAHHVCLMKVPSPLAVGKILSPPPTTCLSPLAELKKHHRDQSLVPFIFRDFPCLCIAKGRGSSHEKGEIFARCARMCTPTTDTVTLSVLAWNIIPCGSCKLVIIWWHYTDYKHNPSSVPLCSVLVPPAW